MDIRKTFIEMMIIVLSAASLGIFYNFVAAPKPLAWVYVPRPVEQASDSALFAPSKPKTDDATQATAVATATLPTVKGKDSAQNLINSAGGQQLTINKETPAVIKEKSPAQSSSPDAKTSQPSAKPLEVKYEQVLRLMKDPDILFLDARKEHEFEEGHIPGAKNLNVMEFDKHVPDIIALPRDKRIVVYCGGGLCELSHDLANNLIAFGFTRVFIYLGGYEDWKQQQKNN